MVDRLTYYRQTYVEMRGTSTSTGRIPWSSIEVSLASDGFNPFLGDKNSGMLWGIACAITNACWDKMEELNKLMHKALPRGESL